MSSVIKWVLVLVVLAGGGWLVWYSGWLSTLTGPKTATVVTTVATTTPTAPTPPPQPPINMNGMSDAKDASDAALVQDTAAIDTQLAGLTTDDASLKAAITDKPLPQAN